MSALKNWAGNYTYKSVEVFEPASTSELQELVSSNLRVKALGTRHSFNAVADTEGVQISTNKLNSVVALDQHGLSVTVQAGIRYGDLAAFLESNGFALENMASLPHISVGGAIATATHGSGNGLGCLSTAVEAMKIVTATGELIEVSRDSDPERFAGAVVSIGALGIVAELTLHVEPTYQVEQQVFEWLPFSALEKNFEAIEAMGNSVSFFTDWQTERLNMIWIKRRVAQGVNAPLPDEIFGAKKATRPRHPIGDLPTIHATEQLGKVGPWNDRLPHFRMDFTPSSGEELQTEYFVRRPRIVEALQAVSQFSSRIAPLLQVCEIRTIAPDDLWLSMAYERDSVAIHFTWKAEWELVRALLPEIEAALDPFDPRPHWGKLSTVPAERLQTLYPRMSEFRRLVSSFDPSGKFRNKFMDQAGL